MVADPGSPASEGSAAAKEYSRMQYRWLERLAEYNVPVMEYVPGKQLVVTDALSRRADLEELLQPVRASMSAEQRARWGMVNPEATFGLTSLDQRH